MGDSLINKDTSRLKLFNINEYVFLILQAIMQIVYIGSICEVYEYMQDYMISLKT